MEASWLWFKWVMKENWLSNVSPKFQQILISLFPVRWTWSESVRLHIWLCQKYSSNKFSHGALRSKCSFTRDFMNAWSCHLIISRPWREFLRLVPMFDWEHGETLQWGPTLPMVVVMCVLSQTKHLMKLDIGKWRGEPTVAPSSCQL